jgi:hypothetical protein
MTGPTQETSRPKSASVRKEYELLKELAHAPESVNGKLREAISPALSTQGSLAGFECHDCGIVGMSLNTHKAIANNVIDGGYAALNDYRQAALKKLKERKRMDERPGRGTIDWYKNELAMKSKQLAIVVNDIALMSQRLDEVLALAQRMAEAAGKQDEFQKRRGELLRKFKQPTLAQS